MECVGSDLWDNMGRMAATAPERGLQAVLIGILDQVESAMAAQSLSYGELAKRTGLRVDAVQRMMQDPGSVKLAHLVRIANALGMWLQCDLKEIET